MLPNILPGDKYPIARVQLYKSIFYIKYTNFWKCFKTNSDQNLHQELIKLNNFFQIFAREHNNPKPP